MYFRQIVNIITHYFSEKKGILQPPPYGPKDRKQPCLKDGL